MANPGGGAYSWVSSSAVWSLQFWTHPCLADSPSLPSRRRESSYRSNMRSQLLLEGPRVWGSKVCSGANPSDSSSSFLVLSRWPHLSAYHSPNIRWPSSSLSVTASSPQAALPSIVAPPLPLLNVDPQLTDLPTATNGIVLATEKKSASLLLDTSVIEKVAPICPNIGFVYSGMGPDFRVLVAKARKIAQAYWKVYGEYPPTKVLVQDVAGIMQKATQTGGVRPYGISLLIAGWDNHRGQSLYQVDPSGSYWAWKASAIGKNMVNGKTFLEKRYNDELSLEDAIHTALLTLKEGFEGQMTEETIEIGVITCPTAEQMVPKSGERLPPTFRKLSEQEVRDYLAL